MGVKMASEVGIPFGAVVLFVWHGTARSVRNKGVSLDPRVALAASRQVFGQAYML